MLRSLAFFCDPCHRHATLGFVQSAPPPRIRTRVDDKGAKARQVAHQRGAVPTWCRDGLPSSRVSRDIQKGQ